MGSVRAACLFLCGAASVVACTSDPLYCDDRTACPKGWTCSVARHVCEHADASVDARADQLAMDSIADRAKDGAPSTCGDGVRTASEPCDGSDLGGKTCQTEGFEGGSLSCAADCTSLVMSGCFKRELLVLNYGANNVTVHSAAQGGSLAPVRTFGSFTGLHVPEGVAVDPTHKELFVASSGNDSVTVYQLTDSGNVTPKRTIAGTKTGLSEPQSITYDAVNDELVVAGGFATLSWVAAFPRTASGDVAPVRRIVPHASTGTQPQLARPYGVAVDATHDEVFVANGTGNDVLVYARTATGAVAPKRYFIVSPWVYDVAVHPASDELYVVNGTGTVYVFDRMATGSPQPKRQIKNSPHSFMGVAVDAVNDEIVLASYAWTTAGVVTYPRTWDPAKTDVPPYRTLAGPATQLASPVAVASGGNEIFVADNTGWVMAYPRTASGNSPSSRTIGVSGLHGPSGLALDSARGEVFVTNQIDASVAVYSKTANGPAAAPLRMIKGPSTNLGWASGVALDTKRDELLVVMRMMEPLKIGALAVFARTAGGDVAPLRSVSGTSTEIYEPRGVAADAVNDEAILLGKTGTALVFAATSSGNIAPKRMFYISAAPPSGLSAVAVDNTADEVYLAQAESVFALARTATGAAVPIRTITGASTGLSGASAIALDTKTQELFVANQTSSTIAVFNLKDSGNVAPKRMIAGTPTGLNAPVGLALSW